MRFLTTLAVCAAFCVSAAAATFTIDPAQSTVTLSGTLSPTGAPVPLQQQGPGSLTTRLDGSFNIEVAGDQISISSATIDARTNGVWRPGPSGQGGSAMADFGAQANAGGFLGTIYGALRDIVMAANSPARTLTNGTTFDASAIVFSFPEGSASSLDFEAGFAGSGRRALAAEATNNAATLGTITGAAGSRVLTLDVQATFVFSLLLEDDTELSVTGRIVAREGGPAPQGPQIADFEVTATEVRVTADGTSAATKLLSSSNLTNWGEKTATVTVVDADTRIFTAPRGGAYEFYQLQQ